MTSDHVVVVVDERVSAPPFDIGPGWLGPDVEVTVPADAGDLQGALARATVILTAHVPVTAGMMDAAPHLRLVAKGGIGVDNIDVEAAHARDIFVSNVPGVRGRAVAEHALALVLALARRVWAPGRQEWMGSPAMQLQGRVLGVLGMGSIGRPLGAMGRGIGMDVIGATRTPRTVDGIETTSLDAVFDDADVVVCCLPATPETRHAVGGRRLRRLGPDALLVNVGRGTTVATDDLVAVLEEGRLGGVGLDVTDPEPLPDDHPLRRHRRVIITPHIGGHSDAASEAAMRRLRSNVEAVVAGGRPHDLV